MQAVAGELHVFDDLSERRTAGVRYRRTFEARMKFFSDGRTADDAAAFEDERPVSSFGEIEGSDERVVATAENEDVALRGHD